MSVQTPFRATAPTSPDAPVRRRTGPWVLMAVLGLLALTTIVVTVRPSPLPPPEVFPTRVGDAIPGQRIVLLVSLGDDVGGATAATVTAEALEFADGVALTVAPAEIQPGEVAEVTVVIDESVVEDLPEDGGGMLGQAGPLRPGGDDTDQREPAEQTEGPQGPEGVLVPVRITLDRDGSVGTTDVTINVSRGEDTLLEAATPLRDRFVAWLATEHPDLGITADTEWSPTIVQPHILVVSHYLFFSEQWEMGLMWHIMIAPHDWSRIYLRPRGEVAPTHAFEIPSVSDPASQIRAIEVPPAVDR